MIEWNLKIQSQYRAMEEYIQKEGTAVERNIENYIHGLRVGITNTLRGTYGTALTQAVITQSFTDLNSVVAPRSERAWVFAPSAYNDLLNLGVFTSTDYSLTRALAEGVVNKGSFENENAPIGSILGSPVYMSTCVGSLSSGSPATTVYDNLYFHKECFGLALQKSPQLVIADHEEYLGTQATTYALYGATCTRPTFGVIIRR